MSNPLIADLFAEDRVHEELLQPVLQRLAGEQGCEINLRIRSARGAWSCHCGTEALSTRHSKKE